MKPKYITFLISISMLGLLAAVLLKPTDQLLEKTNAYLNTYRTNYAPEKVYIHHDKPYYMAGELLWLKAYVVNAATLKATNKSGVLYVDLRNDQNTLIQRLVLPVSDGSAFGDILLPDDLAEGTYRLSGFTQWMRNFGEDTFFQKEIYILKGENEIIRKSELEMTQVDLQFFPEGGDLLAGMDNEVAFKALGSNGYSIPIAASLFDQSGKKVLDFEDHHGGMGAFIFTPESGQRYFAKLNFADGKTIDYPLPQVKEEGYLMKVDELSNPDQISFEISSRGKPVSDLLLLGVAQDSLVFSEAFQMAEKGKYETKIPKSKFPSGIARFTLVSDTGEPFSERLVFVNHPPKYTLQVQTDQASYSTREKVDLNISLDHGDFGPEMSQLSLAVTSDALISPLPQQENIHTYLLLSGDLKGNIESPGYYFENQDRERGEALRYLMMTQGWRRFGWESMLNQQFPEIRYGNEMDLQIRGRLVSNKGEPINKGEALLYLKDRYQTFITTTTNRQGYFNFQGFYFKDTISVMVQGSDSRGRREHVEIEMKEYDFQPPFIPHWTRLPQAYSNQLPEGYVLSTQQQFSAVEAEVGAMDLGELLLQEVVIEGRAEIFEPFTLHNQADVVLYREQLPIAPSGNILESLQGRVAGLQVTQSGMNEFRSVIRGQGTPLYLLDGMPISESTMNSLNQFDISRIEILKNPGNVGIYGGRGAGGVIALFTGPAFEEEEVKEEDVKYLITHRAAGFTKTRQFYSPAFEGMDYYDLPDLRSTVYWNPQVFLKQSKSLSFYTSDTPGNYRVILEGLTPDGHPLWHESTFEVKLDD